MTAWRLRGRWLLAALAVYWLAMAIGTHIPRSLVPGGGSIPWDKLAHFGAFALLAGLLAAVAGLGVRLSWLTAIGVLAAVWLYGALDEATQALVRGRSADWKDWIADAAGAIAGLAAYQGVARSDDPPDGEDSPERATSGAVQPQADLPPQRPE